VGWEAAPREVGYLNARKDPQDGGTPLPNLQVFSKRPAVYKKEKSANNKGEHGETITLVNHISLETH